MNYRQFTKLMNLIQTKGLDAVTDLLALDMGYTEADLNDDAKIVEILQNVGPVYRQFQEMMVEFTKNWISAPVSEQ